MTEEVKTVNIGGTEYPVDDLSPRAIQLVNMLLDIRAKKAELSKQLDVYSAAEQTFNAMLNKELAEDDSQGNEG